MGGARGVVHTAILKMVTMSPSSFACPFCPSFSLATYRMWIGHLRHVHSHDPNFFVTCGINSCPSTFREFTTLYSHVYRKHRDMLELKQQLITIDGGVDPSDGGFNLSLDSQSSFSDSMMNGRTGQSASFYVHVFYSVDWHE